MTRTEKLIAQWEAVKDRFRFVAIIVKFDGWAWFVYADDPDRQETLDEAVRFGGKAIGFIAISKDGESRFHQAFPGCQRDEPELAFLAQVELSGITGDFSAFPPEINFMFEPHIVQ